MVAAGGHPWTAHTTSRVPFILVGAGSARIRAGTRLADIAPTILSLLGLPRPPEMTGADLLDIK